MLLTLPAGLTVGITEVCRNQGSPGGTILACANGRHGVEKVTS